MGSLSRSTKCSTGRLSGFPKRYLTPHRGQVGEMGDRAVPEPHWHGSSCAAAMGSD